MFEYRSPCPTKKISFARTRFFYPSRRIGMPSMLSIACNHACVHVIYIRLDAIQNSVLITYIVAQWFHTRFSRDIFASVNEPVPVTADARLNEQVHSLAITLVSLPTSPVVSHWQIQDGGDSHPTARENHTSACHLMWLSEDDFAVSRWWNQQRKLYCKAMTDCIDLLSHIFLSKQKDWYVINTKHCM